MKILMATWKTATTTTTKTLIMIAITNDERQTKYYFCHMKKFWIWDYFGHIHVILLPSVVYMVIDITSIIVRITDNNRNRNSDKYSYKYHKLQYGNMRILNLVISVLNVLLLC